MRTVLKIVLGAMALAGAASASHAGHLDRFHGLVCKTPEGVKAVFAVHDSSALEGTPADLLSEIKIVNDKEGAEDCRYRQILETDQDVVTNFQWRDQNFDVKRIEVWADCRQGFCIYSKEDDGYIAAENHDTQV